MMMIVSLYVFLKLFHEYGFLSIIELPAYNEASILEHRIQIVTQ